MLKEFPTSLLPPLTQKNTGVEVYISEDLTNEQESLVGTSLSYQDRRTVSKCL